MKIWNPSSAAARTIGRIAALLFVAEFLLYIVFAALSGQPTFIQPIRTHGLLVGTAVDPALLKEPQYAGTIAREFNMVEAENSMKWAAIHPQRDVYDFREGDALVQFAAQYNMKVRGHCLLWGAYLPHWLGAPEVRADLATSVRNHIHTVVSHYRGQVFAWDVVNEAFNADGSLKPTFWFNRPGMNVGPGTKYIENAFVWAREADPTAKLFYNEFAAEELNAKSDAVYAMVKDFKQRGVPIDGVGFQAHLTLDGLNVESFKANIARFAALGVEVHLTELDVAIPKHTLFGYAKQAKVYKDVVEACFAYSSCTAIQVWGVTDKHSWIPQFTNGAAGAALLFDSAYQPKPAYRAFVEAITSGKDGK